MAIFRVIVRENTWQVLEIEADDEDDARHVVESMTKGERYTNAVDAGCNDCGIESIEKIED